MFFALLLLVLTVWRVTTAAPNIHILSENGGAKPAAPHQYPWMVRMDASAKAGLKQEHTCGAFLLPIPGNSKQSDMVMTAAHCIVQMNYIQDDEGKTYAVPTSKYRDKSERVLVFGAHLRVRSEQGTEMRNVSAWEYHASWNPENMPDIGADIALIRIDTPVTFSAIIQPIPLPRENDIIETNTECVTAGWGEIAHEKSSDTLYHMNVTINSVESCQQDWKRLYKSELMYCVSPEGKQLPSACDGDSGGPLFCKQQEKWTAHGVTSAGDGENTCSGDPAMENYSKTSLYAKIEPHLGWINEKISEWTSVKAEVEE